MIVDERVSNDKLFASHHEVARVHVESEAFDAGGLGSRCHNVCSRHQIVTEPFLDPRSVFIDLDLLFTPVASSNLLMSSSAPF
jgi:hypothetical protein